MLLIRKYNLTNVSVVIVKTKLYTKIGILKGNRGHMVTIYLKTGEENNWTQDLKTV